MNNFWDGFEKKAGSTLSVEHEKRLLPHFKKYDQARKKFSSGKLSHEDYTHHSMGYMNETAKVSGENGMNPNDIHSHMDSRHAYDRKQ